MPKTENFFQSNEESFFIDPDSRGIRLDVFVKDTNQIFDAEMQVKDTKDLPERSRYYQGVMDVGDRAYKHFFIAKNCVRMIEDKEIKSFFEFLISNKASGAFTSNLKDYVVDARHNTQWRMQYMTWERQQAYARDEGIELGIQENKIANARNLLREGDSPEKIARCCSLPLEEVLALKESLSRETAPAQA